MVRIPSRVRSASIKCKSVARSSADHDRLRRWINTPSISSAVIQGAYFSQNVLKMSKSDAPQWSAYNRT
jgi:hypothetical protein